MYIGLLLKISVTGDIACNSTLVLNNETSGYPVIINEFETGLDGVACVGCAVDNSQNVISSSTSDYGQIQITAGVAARGTIAVWDVVDTFPIGSVAGFAIEDLESLVEVDLFNRIRICTYLDGVQQECQSGGSLLDLSALTLDVFWCHFRSLQCGISNDQRIRRN